MGFVSHAIRICALFVLCFAAPWMLRALDAVDASFAPVIRGAGSVRAMAWHPESERLYVSVSGDKLNGQMLTTSLVRFDAAGAWEPSYSPTLNGAVSQIKVLADGKILIAGSFNMVDGHPSNRVARLLNDGTVDTAFTVSGSTLPSNPTALAAAPDGTIYVGASGYPQTQWTSLGYVTVWPKLLFKVSPTGILGAAFGPEFSFVTEPGAPYYYFGDTVAVNALSITPQGDVLAGGNFTQVNGVTKKYLARLSESGVLDTSYDAQLSYTDSSGYYGYFGNSGLGVSVLTDAADGKTYAAGTFNTVNGYAQMAVARLNANGSLDPAFRINFSSPYYSGSVPSISRLITDSADRVVVVGSFEGIDGVSRSGVARVDAYGRLDVNFGTNFGNQDHAILLPEDAIAFGRTGSLASNGVVQPPLGRISATGVADATFRPDLRNRRYPDWLTARPNQGPLVGSIWIKEINGLDSAGGVAALNRDGTVDSSFATRLAVNGAVNTSLVLPDGRILLGGSFTTVGGLSRPRLAMVEADGTPVTAFNLGSGPGSDVRMLKLLPSGKVLFGGYFTALDGETCHNVALLDLTAVAATEELLVEEVIEARYGTDLLYRDVTSRLESALSGGAINLAINPTAMGGDPAAGATKFLTVRYRTNRGERTTRIRDYTTLKLPSISWDSGLIDPGFRPEHTESLSLTDAVEQADGKLLLLGSFSTFAGQGIARLVRLHPNGALDTTFAPQTQFSSFYPNLVRLDTGGRIYLGGSSMTLTGNSNSRPLYRLLSDGTYDPTFACPAFISGVSAIVVTPDDSIWCAGSFSSSNSAERRRIARLLPSGAVDVRFDSGESANSTVNALALEAPNKLWISGSFASVQGSPRDGVALLNLSAGIAPLAQMAPTSIATDEGATVRFYLAGTGTGETYAWLRSGVVIAGASGPFLTISESEPIDAGTYSARVVNSAGQTLSSGTLTVSEASLQSWLTLRGIPEAAGDHDADGDGQSNEAEYLARTDPRNSQSLFVTTVESQVGSVRLRWTSYPGRQYVIEESDDLATWDGLGAPISGDGTEKVADVPFGPSDKRLFWRVRVSR